MIPSRLSIDVWEPWIAGEDHGRERRLLDFAQPFRSAGQRTISKHLPNLLITHIVIDVGR